MDDGHVICGMVNPDLVTPSTPVLKSAWHHSTTSRCARPGLRRSGGISWLAHSTLQDGLWIDSQQRYDQVMGETGSTCPAFSRAGWRTVSDIPSDDGAWAQGKRVYGFDKMYNSKNVGYPVPGSAMPGSPTSTRSARSPRTSSTGRDTSR